jgi:hypothetical protein
VRPPFRQAKPGEDLIPVPVLDVRRYVREVYVTGFLLGCLVGLALAIVLAGLRVP